MRNHSVINIAAASLLMICTSCAWGWGDHDDDNNDKYWPLANIDLENSRDASSLTNINSDNVNNLTVKWTYTTLPDSALLQGLTGSITSSPSVKDGKVYFTDWSGNITALNEETGAVIWKKNFITDISVPGMSMNLSRNTPVIVDDKVIVGNEYLIDAPLCSPNEAPSLAIGCHKGDGAIVVALNKNTGDVIWRKKVESHPAAKVTGSVSVHDGVVFVPVASWEEDWARNYTALNDPSKPYPCCSFRGSVVALDVKTGNTLWKTYNAIGTDSNNELPKNVRKLLTEQGGNGYWGVSTYGHSPTVDTKRNQVYYATAQTYTAPNALKLCEDKRRATKDPNANIPGLPPGVTCNNLNEKLNTYGNAIVALHSKTGKVKWSFFARKYDAWNHACDAPDLGVGSEFVPVIVPLPLANKNNCPKLVGPDYGFGHQPMLIKNAKCGDGKNRDLVVAGNKDGRLFALDATTGKLIWESQIEPGAVYGGIQFGIANDGKQIYVGTANSYNNNRNVNTAFLSEEIFRDKNCMGTCTQAQVNSDPAKCPCVGLGLRGGLHHARDGDAGSPRPGPGAYLPFPAPQSFWGTRAAEYAGVVPDPMIGPASGPKTLWTLINPPSDIAADGVNVVNQGGKLKAITGLVTAIDVGTGKIRWQRPAIDGISGQIKPSMVHGSVTVANGVVFAGYGDQQGTLVALDAKNGKKLFEFHTQIKDAQNQDINFGMIESGPTIVGNKVYWGMGAGTAGPFYPGNAGNKLYMFTLE